MFRSIDITIDTIFFFYKLEKLFRSIDTCHINDGPNINTVEQSRVRVEDNNNILDINWLPYR